jgi:hypothetical protein
MLVLILVILSPESKWGVSCLPDEKTPNEMGQTCMSYPYIALKSSKKWTPCAYISHQILNIASVLLPQVGMLQVSWHLLPAGTKASVLGCNFFRLSKNCLCNSYRLIDVLNFNNTYSLAYIFDRISLYIKYLKQQHN